jgi:hypothetical protein
MLSPVAMPALPAAMVPIVLGALVAAMVIGSSIVVVAIVLLRSRPGSGEPPEL